MENIMLDLETMGTRHDAAIVAIGAVRFTDKGLYRKSAFYQVVDLESCLKKRMSVTGSTIMWWLQQSDEARAQLRQNAAPIEDALKAFLEWKGKDANVRVWGNGSDFDNVILTSAFRKFGIHDPWPHYMNRCYRTVKDSWPKVEVSNEGIAHKAVDDAIWQARYLVKLAKTHNLKGYIS